MMTAKKTEREQRDLKGPVRIVDSRTFEFSRADGDLVERLRWAERTTFDQEGRSVEFVHGNQLYPEHSFHATYRYHVSDLQEECERFHNGKLVGKVIRRFSAQGQLSEIASYSAEGRLTERRIISYDETGRKAHEMLFRDRRTLDSEPDAEFFYAIEVEGANGGFSARGGNAIQTLYSQFGYPEEVQVLSKDNEIISRVLIRTDSSGRATHLAHCVRLDKILPPEAHNASVEPEVPEPLREHLLRALRGQEEMVSETLISWDDEGRKIEESSHWGPLLQHKKVIRYEENGDRIEEMHDSNGSVQKARFQLKLDSWKNWVEQRVSTWNEERHSWEPVTLHRRTITYFH